VKSYSHEVKDFPGFHTRPFTWEGIETKFDRLVGDHADQSLREEIKAAVASLESLQVKNLMKLLGHVKSDSGF
jgi:2-methylcitrate dehydratase